ncbi:HutD/Ves family protein [Trinickia sp.]|uniref:HutD/Ves family protein n=1 Tax=Trinickia sp. TaxID=2571163 RepID=UPI003F7F09ED
MSLPSQALRRGAAGSSPSPRTPARIVRASALKATPWRNGGGVTREIAAYPVGASLDTFVWRVSVADVEQPGPFSRFAGIDRTLVLLAGAGMRLMEASGATHALSEPLSIARFAGEAAIAAQLVDGPTRDFNLMVRRDRARAELHVWQGAGQHTLDADAALVLCACGALDVRFESAAQAQTLASASASAPPVYASLATLDTIVLDAPRALTCDVTGEGAALAVLVHYC